MSDAFYENLAIGSQVGGSIVFLIVVVWLWFKYLAPAVAASQIRKNAELDESIRRRDEEKATIERANAEVASATNDAAAIRERGTREAQAEAQRIVSEAKADAGRTLANADGELARSRASASAQFREDLLAKAMQIAREAAAKVDDNTNARIVSSTIENLERGST